MDGRITLRAEALSIGYPRARGADIVIASDLDFVLRAGELVCLLGPNGAGKSTLMRTLARLQSPLSGRIWLDDRPLHELQPSQLARRLSVVLTERVDVGALSGYGLVSLGRHPYTGWTGTLTGQDRHIVRWALQAVRANGLAERLVQEMSDGERQKILIARALAQEPLVMLLDEPTAFLDLPRRVEVMGLLRRLAQENQQTILLSTHDLDLALRNADRLWLLSATGTLYEGAPEDQILNGAFERVFAGEGVTFDQASGSFYTQRETHGQLVVRGPGPAAFWARRALERIGYEVVEMDAQTPVDDSPLPVGRPTPTVPVVSVGIEEGRPVYVLDIAGRENVFTTLGALTIYLRRIREEETLMPRLTKIYTRKGDSGTTALGGGQRVPKDSLRVQVYGTVDELNSQLGVALAHGLCEHLQQTVSNIQNELFHLGSDLCFLEEDKPRYTLPQIGQRHVEKLEALIDELTPVVGPLENFILPGGSLGASQLHVARTVCRRAERDASSLATEETINPLVLRYLNRLSDALFVMARFENHQQDIEEPLWDPAA